MNTPSIFQIRGSRAEKSLKGATLGEIIRKNSVHAVSLGIGLLTIGAGTANAQSGITAGIGTFSLFSESDAYISNSMTIGTNTSSNIAIGGNFTDSGGNWGVSGTTSLYVDGNATMSGGNIKGAFKIGGTANLSNVNQTTADEPNDSPKPPSGSTNQLNYTATGSGSGTTGVNFSSSDSNFQTINAGLIANNLGTTVGLTGSSLVFTVTGNPTTAYFNVTAANINLATSGISLVGAGATTTVIINVISSTATTFTFPQNSNFSGFNAAYDMFNIQSTITGFGTTADVQAAVLAPASELVSDGGHGIKGDVIVNTVGTSGAPVSGGTLGGTTFLGVFSYTASGAVPEPGSCGLLGMGGTLLAPIALRKRRAARKSRSVAR